MLNYIETIGLLVLTFGHGWKALCLIRTAIREGGRGRALATLFEPEVAIAVGRALVFVVRLGKKLLLGLPPTT